MEINAKNLDLIVYDFDGVFTNNKVFVFEDGKEAVICNRADGLAIQKIREYGTPQIILSTETNSIVQARAKKVGIDVISGVNDKKSTLIDYCQDKGFSLKKVLYVGNDINDLEVMKSVGHPLAPLDANDKVKNISSLVVQKNGGDGVIKEIFDTLLKF